MKKFLEHPWSQAIAIILTLLCIAVAAEHRATVLEMRQDADHTSIIELSKMNANTAAILADIVKRHAIKDALHAVKP